MPRYLVERHFPDGLAVPVNAAGADACARIVHSNATQGVTWIHSYVSADRRDTLCIYDAPSPDAIRETASRNGLPVGAIREVRVLDPYFHH